MPSKQKYEHRSRTVQRSLVEVLTRFDQLPTELQYALALTAQSLNKLTDAASRNALHYTLSMDRAIARYPGHEWNAVHTQLMYILTNLGQWKGETARETKLTLTRYAKAIEEACLTK